MDALLEALQSPSNELRGAAEAELQRCRSQPDTLCVSLARVLTSAASRSDLREVAAVLLRRLACGGEAPLWPALQGPTRDALKQELLRCFTAEAAVPGAALAKKVGDLLSEARALRSPRCVREGALRPARAAPPPRSWRASTLRGRSCCRACLGA